MLKAGICSATQTLTATQINIISSGVGASLHAISQGVIVGISGGDVLSGISSGGISSLVASAVGLGGAAAGINGSKTFGTLFFGTLSGGFGSALTGGNFWQGAATGLVVSGLNHTFHSSEPKDSELLIFDDTERVHGNGHTSIAGGNDKQGWEYVSSEGRVDTSGNFVTGGESEVTSETFKTKKDLLNSTIIQKGGYNKMITIGKLTYSEVNKAMKVALIQAKSYYQFATSNCFHVVAAAMRSIGLYDGGIELSFLIKDFTTYIIIITKTMVMNK